MVKNMIVFLLTITVIVFGISTIIHSKKDMITVVNIGAQEEFELFPLENDIYLGKGFYDGYPVYVFDIKKDTQNKRVIIKEAKITSIKENDKNKLIASRVGWLKENYVVEIADTALFKDYGVIKTKNDIIMPVTPIIILE
ncbi:hypothetical protein NE686_17505 [Tissierella carlieri]|uniref:NusG domain-containing protein n=1 Tax=Tissierella carlieri TaxID=689904 RepID=A0ABT1SG60_9FIRM|nr:hypothetical protein [Tissierella carlieri]MCQ4924902.1 hypothetical protein [Tissierella carlieri]